MLVALLVTVPIHAADVPGFRRSPWYNEQVREEWVGDGIRVVVNVAGDYDPTKPTRLVAFATPNGNSIEQTLGCAKADGLDWHFDIQHVVAQVRRLRNATPGENVVLSCFEADGLSWPAWRKKHTDSPARIVAALAAVRGWLPRVDAVELACHSGGGSFLFGFLNAAAAIPADVRRIVFLDANYSYSDADGHGDKLLAWLEDDDARRLVVIAYDDRNITLNGKRVVGPDGGTFRATERMRSRFAKDVEFAEATDGDATTRTALGGRLALIVHANPANAILHTALVGEMNGLSRGLDDRAAFGKPRAYAKWVQPAPAIPPRPADAVGGTAFMEKVAALPPAEREGAIAAELLRGNLPDFLRQFKTITVSANGHTATVAVMPDYLAVGSDADFVRVPMTPMTAARVADAFGCALPTRKLVNDMYRAATVKLEPRPLTEAREAVETFVQHHRLIEAQRAGKPLGELVAGIKKDVVVTNRLAEKPKRVAIYGWHKLDGVPIQPLNVSHVNRYVDYSHGVRLMKRAVVVDGKPRDVRPVLYDAALCALVSDEGPLRRPTY